MTDDDDVRMYRDMPVARMFLRCSVPCVISTVVWAICSITDGVFIGRVIGGEALAAMNIAWPVMMIATAVSDMIATGASVRVGICLGRGDGEQANRIFTNSMAWIVGIGVAFMLAGLFLAEPMMGLMGATGDVAGMASSYFLVFALMAPLSLLFFATDNYLRICGRVNYSMYVNVLVAVLNIVLDALFLVVMQWGMWSAALATSLSLCIGAVLSVLPFLRGRLALRFTRGRVDLRTLWNIMYNGASNFFNSVSGAVFMIFANWTLLAVSGTMAVSAFGIIMEINTVASALFMGMAVAVQPALSYNHGSGNGSRVLRITNVLFAASLAVSVIVFLMTLVIAEDLVSVFIENEAEIASMATDGMMIFAVSYLFSWLAVGVNLVLTSVDRPGQSLAVGMLSQMVFPIAAMALMADRGLDGVWWSIVVASAASAAISLMALHRAGRDGVFRDRRTAEGHS